jgi:hypothetical protein
MHLFGSGDIAVGSVVQSRKGVMAREPVYDNDIPNYNACGILLELSRLQQHHLSLISSYEPAPKKQEDEQCVCVCGGRKRELHQVQVLSILLLV